MEGSAPKTANDHSVSVQEVMSPHQFIVIAGNPTEGFIYIGPFHSWEDAQFYCEDMGMKSDYWIGILNGPVVRNI